MTRGAAAAPEDGGATGESAATSLAVTVNGERRLVPTGTTLSDLLRAHALDPRLVVVEHNRVILRDRTSFPSVVLRDGDALELVHFVGGG